MNYTKTPKSNDHAKIRAIGEDNNEQIRTLYKQEAKQKKHWKIIKWITIILILIIIIGLAMWDIAIFRG